MSRESKAHGRVSSPVCHWILGQCVNKESVSLKKVKRLHWETSGITAE